MRCKSIVKKLNIVLALVLIFCCAFALPCSASYTLNITPSNLTNLKAYYEKGEIVDTGTQTLSYTGMGMVNGAVYYKYSNAPFNVGAPTYEGNNGQSYSVAVEISNLNFQLPFSSENYTVRTRVAIGTNSQILSFPDKFYFGLYTQGGRLVKNCDFTINGNVAYVEDILSFDELRAQNLSLRLEFQFGSRFNSSVTWSNSTHLWLTNIIFERPTDNSDIQNSVNEQTNSILNENGDGSITNNTDSFNSSIDSYEERRDDFDNFIDSIGNGNSVNGYNPDNVDKLAPSFTYLGTAFTWLIEAFGSDFTTLWWVLVSIGIAGACFGIVALVFRRFKS